MSFNHHNADHVEIRPRFKLISTHSNAEVLIRIQKMLPHQNEINAKIKGNHVFLKITAQDQHYWSPVMEVVVEKYRVNDEKSHLRCLVGPRQSIWVLLMFFYIAVGVLAFFGGMYGLAKWNLGKESIFIWTIPVSLFLYGVIYLTSKYGQRKGRDQVLHLVSFLYHALDDKDLERR